MFSDNHKIGDLVYQFSGYGIGIINEYSEKRDTYCIKWLNEDDELYQRPLMKEFTGTMIVWFKRDLQEALGNDGTQNR